MQAQTFRIEGTIKVGLPGFVKKLAINRNGIIFAVISQVGHRDRLDQSLIGLSPEGDILWTSELKVAQPNEMRLTPAGDCLLSFSNAIHKISERGELEEVISFSLKATQDIGTFVALSDGFIIGIQGKEGPDSAVIRADTAGATVWKTEIPTQNVSYGGIVEMRADNDWRAAPKPPWSPTNWLCLDDSEMIVSNNNVLASYFEMPRSGVGKAYLLDLATGKVKWISRPAPFESISCPGDGRFLLGHQGYGEFNTVLIDDDGQALNEWASAGKTLVSADKYISLIEMKNMDTPLYHATLNRDGSLSKGVLIPGIYIVYPVLDNRGNLAFWRNNELTVVDARGEKHRLMSIEFAKNPYTSQRMLLYGEGQLIFSLNKDLYLLRTNLGTLAQSSWPCQFGNNERNPVIN